jgi:hypothetical protein
VKLTGCPTITNGLLDISRTVNFGVYTITSASATTRYTLSELTVETVSKLPDLVVFTTMINSIESPTPKEPL